MQRDSHLLGLVGLRASSHLVALALDVIALPKQEPLKTQRQPRFLYPDMCFQSMPAYEVDTFA